VQRRFCGWCWWSRRGVARAEGAEVGRESMGHCCKAVDLSSQGGELCCIDVS